MSVADRKDQGDSPPLTAIDPSELGTISQAALDADRRDPKRVAEHQAALAKLDALERDGRLLLS